MCFLNDDESVNIFSQPATWQISSKFGLVSKQIKIIISRWILNKAIQESTQWRLTFIGAWIGVSIFIFTLKLLGRPSFDTGTHSSSEMRWSVLLSLETEASMLASNPSSISLMKMLAFLENTGSLSWVVTLMSYSCLSGLWVWVVLSFSPKISW